MATLLLVPMAGLLVVPALLLVLMAGLAGAIIEPFLLVAGGVSCPEAFDFTLHLQPLALPLVLPFLVVPSSSNSGTSFDPVTNL